MWIGLFCAVRRNCQGSLEMPFCENQGYPFTVSMEPA